MRKVTEEQEYAAIQYFENLDQHILANEVRKQAKQLGVVFRDKMDEEILAYMDILAIEN